MKRLVAARALAAPLVVLGLGLGADRLAPAQAAPPAGQATSAAIDSWIEARLAADGLVPLPIVDDAAFLRRVTLDLHGTLPADEALRRFEADAAPDKRARLVRALLDDRAFAARWSEPWAEELASGLPDDEGGRFFAEQLRAWLEQEVHARRGLDAIAARLVAAEGRTDEEPAGIYALAHGLVDPADLAGAAARDLLGQSIACARCHDHPFAPVEQATFHGLAAYFARLRVRPEPGKVAVFRVSEGPVGEHRFTPSDVAGAAMAPRREIEPRPPGPADLPPGTTPPGVTRTSRRAALARWITSPANPHFARAQANRAWARLMGRGLLEPLDDLGADAASPRGPLLDLLARDLVASGFALDRFVEAICGSRAYQRASTSTDPAALPRLRDALGAARVRPLDARTLGRALLAVAGRDRPRQGELPTVHAAAVRRVQEELAAALPRRGDAGRGDPDFAPAALGLALTAGRAVTAVARGPAVDRLLALPRDARVEALWRATLSRAPRPDERAAAPPTDARAAWEDLVWAVLATTEFGTNH